MDNKSKSKGMQLKEFVQKEVALFKQLGRVRSAETYQAAYNSLRRFCGSEEILLSNISSTLMQSYEAYLKDKNISKNTISFYMRNLRAIYNRAVEANLVKQAYPFKNVYTGIGKTGKRALSLKHIKKIKHLDLSDYPELEFARNIFLFSFYTRGMSFIDIAYLRKSNLHNSVLTYTRRKTDQQLTIKWEPYMQVIIDKNPCCDSHYLLPLITNIKKDERMQYKNAINRINASLKKLATKFQLPTPLTMYIARHSWASIAKTKNIPISIISDALGHDSETTTQIYLSSIETSIIDEANLLIFNLL